MPLTASGKVVLVRLTYAPGWRRAGRRPQARGNVRSRGCSASFGRRSACSRHGAVERLEEVRPGDPSAFFLVRDVVYRPRRSFEVEEVREFDPARLPRTTPDPKLDRLRLRLGAKDSTAC